MGYDISVIIPAYNAEKYLENAVKSVINNKRQHMAAVEIIIVENGSTDHTWQIANQLQTRHENVHAVQSEKGVSCARNKGLKIASGMWICFLDADDQMTEEAFSAMTEIIEQKASDLFVFGYWKNGQKILPDIDEKISLPEKKAELIKNPTRYLAVWGKLFSRIIVQKYGIQFNPTLALSEDSDFLIHYMRYCNDISFSDACVYRYNTQGNSSTRGFSGDKKAGYLRAIHSTQEKIADQEKCVKHAFAHYTFMQMNLIMVKDVFCKENKISFTKKCRDLKNTCEESVFKDALSELSLRECVSPRLLPAILCKLHLWHLCGMVYWLRDIQNRYRSSKI